MSDKPVIFISYSHKDEPEHPRDGEVQWLTFVRTYLQPAVKHGVFDLWVDRHMIGGADWNPEIEQKLRECQVFILLVSPNSMSSDYIVDKEIAIIRERQAKCPSEDFLIPLSHFDSMGPHHDSGRGFHCGRTRTGDIGP